MKKNLSSLMAVLLLLLLQPAVSFAKKLQLPGRAQLIEGIVFKSTPTGRLCAALFRPDSLSSAATPVFVFIHGGSWMELNRHTIRTGFRKTILDKLLENGYSVVSIDYRLVNYNNDVAYPEPLADCKDAIRWVRKEAAKYHFNVSGISVGGCSAGGHLAMMAAYAPDLLAPGDKGLSSYSSAVNSCIDIYGPTLLSGLLYPRLAGPALWAAKLFFPSKAIKMRKALLWSFSHQEGKRPLSSTKACRLYSPLMYTDSAVPTLILHGTKDKVVPYSQARKLEKRLRKNHVYFQMKPVEGQDHGFPSLSRAGRDEIAEAVVDFVDAFGAKQTTMAKSQRELIEKEREQIKNQREQNHRKTKAG